MGNSVEQFRSGNIMIRITKKELEAMTDGRHRARLINCLSGVKTAILIGTVNKENQSNVAVFSSLFHLGANPALMGFIVRPDVSPRHTYQNILDRGEFTCNILGSKFQKSIHHTSARFSEDQSEFKCCGLEEEYIDGFVAPFVKESPLKWSMSLVRVVDIPENGTHMVIGAVEGIFMEKDVRASDGFLNLYEIDPCLVSGLDCYHQVKEGQRYSYAKADQVPVTL